MVKKQDDKMPEDGEINPKKKGLFSFFHRGSKSETEQSDSNDADINNGDGTLADDALEPKKKKALFGFLKRKTKADSKEEQAESSVITKKQGVDISIPPVGGDVLGMDTNPIIEEKTSKKKSGFFTKKVTIIFFTLCGVSAATGAAAIVFGEPLFGGILLRDTACKVAYKVDFVLMKEKRVTAFIRSGLLPPKQRIEMLMSYTKFLENEFISANLITVSLIDTEGPIKRMNFRGDNIGAQVVYAPDPLLSMATDTKWEVRYVNVSQTHGGRFMGDRFTLSQDEINAINYDQLVASDCIMEEADAERLAAEEAAAEAETGTEAKAADSEHAGEDMHAQGDGGVHVETVEPSFIDNMLGMVGLGEMDNGDDLQQLNQDYKGPNSDVIGEDTGYFDGLLSLVGRGSDSERQKSTLPGVLGTRVKYN